MNLCTSIFCVRPVVRGDFLWHARNMAKLVASLLIPVVAMSFSGCETPGESALGGAVAGAALGGVLKGTGRDVARGAAIGAVGGYALGKVAESERARGYAEANGTYRGSSSYRGSTPPPAHHHYEPVPYGRFSGTPGYVYSPYSHDLIDVRGVRRGVEVVDPVSGRVFINP